MSSFADYLELAHTVLSDLSRYVSEAPELSGFVPVANELEQQAADLCGGSLHVPRLKARVPSGIPTREYAQEIAAIVARFPPVEEGLTSEEAGAVARLLENLVVGVSGFIFRDFPELIPRDLDTTP